MMRHQIFDSFAGFDDFLGYLAVSLLLLYFFVWLYIRVTPWREMALIRAGNMAASFSLSGAILGFIVPLSAAVKYSVNIVDMVIWGLIALVVQILAFVVIKFLVPSVSQDIEAGNAAQGFFLGVTSLAAGLVNAACMSY
jgi:putative membrane protein